MLGTILTIALIGFVVWAILTYIPMPDLFKKLILVLVVIVVIVWLIGIVGGGPILGLRRLP